MKYLILDSRLCVETKQDISDSGAAVAQELEQSSSNWKIGGSTPGSSSPHVDVSLGKTLNPKLLPLLCQQCMNVNEWLNSTLMSRLAPCVVAPAISV